MKTPKSPAQWQEAVDAANCWLLLDSARQYGLVKGGPAINAARCEEILARGKKLGYVPRAEALEGFIHALARNLRPA